MAAAEKWGSRVEWEGCVGVSKPVDAVAVHGAGEHSPEIETPDRHNGLVTKSRGYGLVQLKNK